ncbi:MAG: hydrogenase maturation nickel metallochaperone HypA [Desulfuromonas sp.]|nr:MAG: hydrogenase maturation nickel metallochaperone HypA [Desulfuromonas sp.]
MHELGITRSIVEIAEQTAREQHAEKVLSVTVEIGELSGVIPDAVEFCFEACVQESMLAGSRLIINFVKGLGRCEECGSEFGMDNMTFNCPECESYAVQRIRGEELRVKEVEIE